MSKRLTDDQFVEITTAINAGYGVDVEPPNLSPVAKKFLGPDGGILSLLAALRSEHERTASHPCPPPTTIDNAGAYWNQIPNTQIAARRGPEDQQHFIVAVDRNADTKLTPEQGRLLAACIHAANEAADGKPVEWRQYRVAEPRELGAIWTNGSFSLERIEAYRAEKILEGAVLIVQHRVFNTLADAVAADDDSGWVISELDGGSVP
ncbi:hypothetical protein DFR70_110243 [Nocardia tenerifensis]|uniref:Uncharacterized protein n=1 Tax=Nocardia tenerifensis TaxID=228006 RepID=A0A318JUQ9_9NOCA|nr:hypothetical protein [Nocardia tenerifensis]PXX60401.1 hypothetical protein DFR70_110243 [Nocardia tenerifensis]